MLVALLYFLVFVGVVVAASYGIEWLSQNGEGIMIAFAGYEVTLGPLQTVIAALALVAAVWLLLKVLGFLVALVRFLTGDETAIVRYFRRARERRGNRALQEGMLALAAGDTRRALDKARLAQTKLADPAIGRLLAAQAAEQSGDKKMALNAYKDLLKNDHTRFIAIHGLMKHKQAAGDEATARQLAAKALELRPDHAETADQLFLMQTHDSDWSGARKTLGLRGRSIPKDFRNRRDGLLALCEARDARQQGDAEGARKAGMEAARLLPNFPPAAVEGARAYMAAGNGSKAAQILRNAWAAFPHPSIAAAYAELEPDETPAKRVKRFENLVQKDPNNAEARMLMAEVKIAAEDFPGARRALGDLMDTEPTARVMTLMAAIERGEGSGDAAVKAWLAKAVTAPRGPQWVCEVEGAVYGEWQPVCDVCGSFDTLTWKPAPSSEVIPDSSAGMLPLIVGALEDGATDSAAEPDTVDVTATPSSSTSEESTVKA